MIGKFNLSSNNGGYNRGRSERLRRRKPTGVVANLITESEKQQHTCLMVGTPSAKTDCLLRNEELKKKKRCGD